MSFKENLPVYCLVAVLLFVGVSLLINTSKSCDTTMQFIAIGPDNETISNESIGNGTVLGIRYECTKLCMNKFYDNSYKLKDCWEQCNKLG